MSNMKKDLYHGSEKILKRPVFGFGKTENDYGRAFYSTESEDLAKERSTGEDHDGFANHYVIETKGLSVLDLNSPETTILHWLSVLLKNRTFPITSALAMEAREYLLKAFAVDYEGFYGMQYVLKSKRAFERLKFVEAVPAFRDPWFVRKTARDETANRTYLDARKKRVPGQLYVTEILDGKIGPHDERLLRALS